MRYVTWDRYFNRNRRDKSGNGTANQVDLGEHCSVTIKRSVNLNSTPGRPADNLLHDCDADQLIKVKCEGEYYLKAVIKTVDLVFRSSHKSRTIEVQSIKVTNFALC